MPALVETPWTAWPSGSNEANSPAGHWRWVNSPVPPLRPGSLTSSKRRPRLAPRVRGMVPAEQWLRRYYRAASLLSAKNGRPLDASGILRSSRSVDREGSYQSDCRRRRLDGRSRPEAAWEKRGEARQCWKRRLGGRRPPAATLVQWLRREKRQPSWETKRTCT